jgi:hypothetical protein
MSSLNAKTAKQVRNLVKLAANAQKVDEHGNWDFGLDFDRKGRGSALNWDLYAVGRDLHTRKTLAVIQIRQFVRQSKNWYPNIKKSYFLLGRNEDNTVFAHPVESRVIHAAIKKDADVIQAVQRWIFGTEYNKVIRQGDVALVPLTRKPNAPTVESNQVLLQDSHELVADEILENGHLYALNPAIIHLPGTHPNYDLSGWYKVIPGKRADFYKFAAPTID